jgi:hypothetical protein
VTLAVLVIDPDASARARKTQIRFAPAGSEPIAQVTVPFE